MENAERLKHLLCYFLFSLGASICMAFVLLMFCFSLNYDILKFPATHARALGIMIIWLSSLAWMLSARYV